jgi:hypothetical protein
MCPRRSTVTPIPACGSGTYMVGRDQESRQLHAMQPRICVPGRRLTSARVPAWLARRQFGPGNVRPLPSWQVHAQSEKHSLPAVTSGNYCDEGAAAALPCPGGTSSNITGLTSSGGGTFVRPGFWGPLGSSAPEPCPSGMYCPGALPAPAHGLELHTLKVRGK